MGLKRMSEATQQQMHLNETGLMSILNACERDYVRGMKRKERGDMSRLLINQGEDDPPSYTGADVQSS